MDIDTHGQTWIQIEQWLQDRKEDCIESLINGSPNDDKLRGQIRLIDDLIQEAQGDESPDIETEHNY